MKKGFGYFLVLILLISLSVPVYAAGSGGTIEINTDSEADRYSAFQVLRYTSDGNITYNKMRCRYTSECIQKWYAGPNAQKLLDQHKKDWGVKAFYYCNGCNLHFYTNEDFNNHCIEALNYNGLGSPCVNTTQFYGYPTPNEAHVKSRTESKTVTVTVPKGSYYIFTEDDWFGAVNYISEYCKDTCDITVTGYKESDSDNYNDLWVVQFNSEKAKEDFYRIISYQLPMSSPKYSVENTASKVSIDNLDYGLYVIVSEDDSCPMRYDAKGEKQGNSVKEYYGGACLPAPEGWIDPSMPQRTDSNTSTGAALETSENSESQAAATGVSNASTPDMSQLQKLYPPTNMLVVADANVVDENGNVLGYIAKGSDIGVTGQCPGFYQVNYGAKRSFLPMSVLANH